MSHTHTHTFNSLLQTHNILLGIIVRLCIKALAKCLRSQESNIFTCDYPSFLSPMLTWLHSPLFFSLAPWIGMFHKFSLRRILDTNSVFSLGGLCYHKKDWSCWDVSMWWALYSLQQAWPGVIFFSLISGLLAWSMMT